MNEKLCDSRGPFILAGFYGALALGAYLGYRAAPKHPIIGGALGVGLFFFPAAIGTYMAAVSSGCGT